MQLVASKLSFYFSAFAVNPWSLPILVTTLSFLGLAIYVVYEFESTSARFYFTVFCLMATGWVAFSAFMIMSEGPEPGLLWSRVTYLFATLTMFSGYVFSLKSVESFSRRKGIFYVLTGSGIVFGFLMFFSDFIIEGVYRYPWGYYPDFAPTAVVYLGYQATLLGLIFSEFLMDVLREHISDRRRKRDWGFVASALVAGLAFTDWIPAYGYDFFPIGFLVILVTAMIIAFTIWQYRLVDYNPAVAAPEVFKAMKDSLIVSDTAGIIRLVNETFCDKTGLDRDTIIGAPLTDVLPEITKIPSSTETVDRLEEEETFIVDATGNEIDVILSTSPMTDSHGMLSGIVFVARDITERKRRQQKLEELEFYDSITGLPNKKYVFNRLLPGLGSIGEAQVFYVEIDNLGELEAALSEVEIPNLLRNFVKRLRSHEGERWEVAHWHQSSFVLLNFDCDQPLQVVGERLIELYDAPLELENRSLIVTVSIGASKYPDHAKSLEETVRKATVALIDAKEVSGNSLQIFEKGGRRSTSEKVDLIADLRSALDNGKLEMYYQPIVDSATEAIHSLEALLRWDHPKKGYIAPQKVISLSEESGLIRDLGNWIFEQTIERTKSLNASVENPIKISLNFSNQQFEQSRQFLQNLDDRLSHLDFDASNLRIEITETTAIQDMQFSKQMLERFHEQSVEVAIDDFGTGHSSMKYLMELPLDVLKIDKSFVLNLFDKKENQALVEAMITMGHELGLEIVAEGVETQDHRDFLRDLDCDYMQGYLWTPPRPYSDLMKYLENYNKKNGDNP